MKDLPKKLTKSEILSALKADMKSADTLRTTMETKVEGWKGEYDGKPYGNEEKGKSSLVSRDIKRQDEWQHASIKDPFVSSTDIIKCAPITFEDRKAAEQNQLILNFQFCRQFPRYQFMTDVIKLFYKEGTVVVKTSWLYEDKIEKVMMPVYEIDPDTGKQVVTKEVEVEQIKVLVNRPDAEICRMEDTYIDPTAMGDPQKAQFFIHRYESDLSSLRASGKYKNLDKINKVTGSDGEADYEEEDETDFKFGDDARRKLLVYEYWGNFDMDNDGIAEPIVCTWVENTIIQLQSNPFPDQKIPFLVVANNSIPFVMHGEANAELIGDNQKLITAIKRGLMDNMGNSNNSQKGIPIGMLDNTNEKRFLSGQNFKFNGTSANLFEGNYNQIPNSVFQVLEMLNNDTESMLGVKSFSGGVNGQGLGSTATAAGGVIDAVSVRRLDIVRNIAENLIKPMMRKWTSYNAEFLQEEEIVRVTNEEFVPIKRDDLEGLIDISVEVSTAEDDAARSQSMAFLLQTLGQSLPTDMLNMVMSQIAKLKKMPDLAKSILEYQPKPDPYVEEMKKLEMEKLKSEIMERRSRAMENETDIRAKTAKAALDEARANHLNSDADLKDLDFTKKAQGDDFSEKMVKKDHDRNSDLMKQKAQNEGKEKPSKQ
jgi:hypothetical protein